VCNNSPINLVLNGLNMKKCPTCNLLWRSEFSLPEFHYEKKLVDFTESKLKARVENCYNRIDSLKKFVDLNNLCDLGTGEGMFLKALKDCGFVGMFGIEPSEQISDFSKKNLLEIYKGRINLLLSLAKTRLIRGVSMFHLIEYLDNPVENLEVIFNTLPIDGYLIIETPNSNSYVLKKTGHKHELIYPEHLFLFNINNLTSLLKRIGFEVVAYGNRDFNPQKMNLHDAFFKLGIVADRLQGNKMNVGQKVEMVEVIKRDRLKNSVIKYTKLVLGWIIRKLGREDYLWIIVKK